MNLFATLFRHSIHFLQHHPGIQSFDRSDRSFIATSSLHLLRPYSISACRSAIFFTLRHRIIAAESDHESFRHLLTASFSIVAASFWCPILSSIGSFFHRYLVIVVFSTIFTYIFLPFLLFSDAGSLSLSRTPIFFPHCCGIILVSNPTIELLVFSSSPLFSIFWTVFNFATSSCHLFNFQMPDHCR
jgi:hypothetical protein